jgi:hypothetical protein
MRRRLREHGAGDRTSRPIVTASDFERKRWVMEPGSSVVIGVAAVGVALVPPLRRRAVSAASVVARTALSMVWIGVEGVEDVARAVLAGDVPSRTSST